MKRVHINLRTLLIILSMMAVLSSTVGGYLYYSTLIASSIESEHHEAIEQLNILRKDIDAYLEWSLLSVKTLAGLKELRQSLLNGDAIALAEANAILDHFCDSMQVNVCYLMDSSGNTIASSNRDSTGSFVGKNYGFRPYFKQAMKGKPTVYMALGVTSKKRGIYYSHPIYNERKERPVGVAVIKAPIDLIEKNFLKSYDGNVILTDPHGVVFVSSHAAWLYHVLWETSSEITSVISKTNQFGAGPWHWAGMKLVNEAGAIDTLGNEYRVHREELVNYPGWQLIYLHSNDQVSNQIITPLRESVGVVVVVLCVFFGLSVSILFKKANTNIIQRKKAEGSLRESEARYRNVYTTAPLAFVMWDLKLRVTDWNERAERVFGWSREEVLGQNFFEFLIPDGAKPQVEAVINLLLQGKLPNHSINTNLTKKGEIILIEWNNSILYDNEGRAMGAISLGLDITERNQAEEDLKESEERFRNLIEGSIQGILIHRDHKPLFVNHTWASIHGYTPDEILRMESVVPLMSQKDQRQMIQYKNARLRGESAPTLYEYQGVRKDGSLIWLENRVMMIQWDRKPAIQTIIFDITERKRAEEALLESEERYRQLIELNPDGICVSRDGKIVFLNRAMVEIWGASNGKELIGKSALDLIHPDYREISKERYKLITEKGGSVPLIDFIFLRLDGEEIHAQAVSSSICFAGKPAVLTAVRDINAQRKAESERARLELQLQQAQKMESIGTLAGGIAHDFNNILFPIVGLSEILLEDLPPDSPEHQDVAEIYKAAERAGDLVKQILTFSRQSEDKMMPVRIQKILDEVLKLMRSTIPSNIEIAHDIQEDCGLVMADATQVHQIAMNLITNAYHAVEPTGGKIFVQLREKTLTQDDLAVSSLQTGQYAMLSVSDTGCGIDPKAMVKIFDPYFTTKEQGKGTGLGLAVVYGIIKQHRGEIKVISKEGKGTTFQVLLPLMEKSDEIVRVEKTEDFKPGNERILLIDDEELIIQVEKQILERLGYKITSRVNSVEALEAFKANPDNFDLVITDMAMPNMTGDQLARELIAIRPDIPIIICTGFSEAITEGKAAEMGIKGFLMKPILRSDLLRLVRKVLDEAKVSDKIFSFSSLT